MLNGISHDLTKTPIDYPEHMYLHHNCRPNESVHEMYELLNHKHKLELMEKKHPCLFST